LLSFLCGLPMNIMKMGKNDKQLHCSLLFSYGYIRTKKWWWATIYYSYYPIHPFKWKGWVGGFFWSNLWLQYLL
jgi:hypothetical protein